MMYIVDICDRLYTSTIKFNRVVKYLRIDSAIRFSVKVIANVIIPIGFRLTAKKYRLEKTEMKTPKIIISLTSFPARIDKVWLVLECLLRQTYKADLIILWLSKEQFKSIDSLPRSLRSIMRRGIQVQFVEGDIRSHKKYYYVFNRFPNSMLVTVDDDIFYRSDMLSTLMEYAIKYPDSIIANYAHKMMYSNKGDVLPYIKWINNKLLGEDIGTDIFFGSGGGVLFKPGSLHSNVLDISKALEICPSADDIWLNAMCRLNNKTVVKTNYCSILLPIVNSSDIRLSALNLSEGYNDAQLKVMNEWCDKMYGYKPF